MSASPQNATLVPQFPPELAAAIQLEAEQDAERVALFLHQLTSRLKPTEKWATKFSLPAGFLLELGAALRLAEWEQCGVVPNTSPALPVASEAIRSVFLRAANHESPAPPVASELIRVFVENFAWSARQELGIAMRLDTVEDDFAAKLAAFVGKYRHLIEKPQHE